MSEEIKDIMDALENNEFKNDGFWGRACSRLSQQLQTAKEDAERYRQEANNASELAQKNLDKYFKAKEENEYRDNMLCEQIEIWRSNCDAWMNQSNKFEQQNKQMREHLKTLKNHCKEWAWAQTFIDEILKGGE